MQLSNIYFLKDWSNILLDLGFKFISLLQMAEGKLLFTGYIKNKRTKCHPNCTTEDLATSELATPLVTQF